MIGLRAFGKRPGLRYADGMLMKLRALAGTWVAKVLFVLLILSFAVWGIEDMLRNIGRETAIARVDGQPPVELTEAQDSLRREVQRLQRATEGRFQVDGRIRPILAQQAVESLVIDRVVGREVNRMGVAVPDGAVRDYIWSIPGFQGADGRFSRLTFDNFLRQNDLTEDRLLQMLRADLARQQIFNAVRAGALVPPVAAQRLLAWQLERRSVNLVELRVADAPEPDAPTEAQLARFHENNADRFSRPELREVSVGLLNAAILVPQMEVSEREIEDAYAAHRARYETPERRRLLQALMTNEEAALRIAELWVGSADDAPVEAAVREAGGTWTDLGVVERGALPLPALATAGFALDANGVSTPVRTPFGWHVLHVTEIQAGATRALAEVREELRQEVAAEKAADAAFDRVNSIQDALAGGASVEEASQRYGMRVVAARIDAMGRNAEGQEVALPVPPAARRALFAEIFTTARGSAPRLHEGEFGFAAIEVKEVTPAALRPLAEVAEEVRAAFIADARRRHQEQRAAALLAATRAGRSLEDAAREAGVPIEAIGPFPRQPGQGNPVPREFLGPIFELRANETTMVPGPTSFAVAQLTGVTAADLSDQAEALATLRQEGAQAVAEDLETQFANALRARSDVRINARLLEQLGRE